MSWTLSLPATKKSDFAKAIDALEVGYELTPEAQKQITTAKKTAKAWFADIDTSDLEYVGCSMSGHAHNPGDAFGSISVNVYGAYALVTT